MIGAHIEGARELERELKRLPEKFGKRVTRSGLQAAGRVAAREARGILDSHGISETGALRKSIGVKVARSGKSVAIGPRKGFQVPNPPGRWSKSGYSDPTKYAHLVELGTAHGPAKPFLRPGMDQNPQAKLDALAKGLSKGLDRLLKQTAKR